VEITQKCFNLKESVVRKLVEGKSTIARITLFCIIWLELVPRLIFKNPTTKTVGIKAYGNWISNQKHFNTYTKTASYKQNKKKLRKTSKENELPIWRLLRL
jgi:hypothetical protein